MTENYFLPTLSPEGWVQSTAEQADYLLAHFFASEFSQTHLYQRNVASFQWIIQESQSDMSKTMSLLKDTLFTYFGRYFDNINVDVNYLQDPPDSSSVTINLYLSFTDKVGKDFILSKALELVNSKIKKIVSLNNDGI